MFAKPINTNEVATKANGLFVAGIVFTIIFLVFLLAGGLLSIDLRGNLGLYSVFYAGLVVTCVYVSKWFLSRINLHLSQGLASVSANAIGLLMTTSAILILQYLLPALSEIVYAVILASVMSFFILGTLIPLLKLDITIRLQ